MLRTALQGRLETATQTPPGYHARKLSLTAGAPEAEWPALIRQVYDSVNLQLALTGRTKALNLTVEAKGDAVIVACFM